MKPTLRDKKTKRLRDKEWGSQWSIVNGQWSIVNGQWSMVKETKSGGVGERKSGREEEWERGRQSEI